MNSSDNVLVFKALANSVRLKIIDTLLDGPKKKKYRIRNDYIR